MSAPQAASSSSVWARVATGSRTTVSPLAPRPARSTQDLTWALATGGVKSIPVRDAPRTTRGGRRPPWRPSTRAPMVRRGTVTRSMGRFATESSPWRTVNQGRGAQKPARSRMDVPELPTSRTPWGSCRRPTPPVTRWPSTSAPMASTAPRVRVTSWPGDRPLRVEVPSARAARSRARWEMDLSPGTVTVPRTAMPESSSRAWMGAASSNPSPQGLDRGPKAAGQQGAPHQVGGAGVDHDEEHAPVPFRGVGDLQVPDVDIELARQGCHLGEHAGAVGHRHPHLDQLLGPGRGPGGKAATGGAGPLQGRQETLPVAPGGEVADLAQGGHQPVQGRDDGVAVLGTDVGPDPGMTGGHPGHVPEATRGQ